MLNGKALLNASAVLAFTVLAACSSAPVAYHQAIVVQSKKVLMPSGEIMAPEYESVKAPNTDIPPGFSFEISHEHKTGPIPPKYKTNGDYVEITTEVSSPNNDAYLDDILKSAYILVQDPIKGTYKIKGRGKKDKYGPNSITAKAYVPYCGDDSQYYALASTKTKDKTDPLRSKIFATEKRNFNSCNENGEIIPEGTCSDTQPLYCEKGKFIPKATICGCPDGFLPSGDSCIVDPIGQYPITSLIVNGTKSKKLDVLFLRDKYGDNKAKFEDDVQLAIDTLFGGEIPTYADNYSKFNIYMMEENPDLSCQEARTTGIDCNLTLIQEFLNYHNIDKAIVLVNDFTNRGSASDGAFVKCCVWAKQHSSPLHQQTRHRQSPLPACRLL